MHDRLSVHQICFQRSTMDEYIDQCRQLGAKQLGFISPALLGDGGASTAQRALRAGDMRVQSIAHVFRSGHLDADSRARQRDRDNLNRLTDIAAELGARSIYMLTGGHGDLSWEAAAETFSEAVAPCIEYARNAGICLAIENASGLYADLHIAHSLADTLALAEMAGIEVCIELFFCWAEADLDELFPRAMQRCALVQASDYVYGDRSLPARAVPGDGAIPLHGLLSRLHSAGYRGAIDIELLGPRIEAEGSARAVARAAQHLGDILLRLDSTG